MPYLGFFSALSDTLVAIAVGGGYTTLFLVTLLEGVPLIGVLIPGHVAIIAAGFVASTGVFNSPKRFFKYSCSSRGVP